MESTATRPPAGQCEVHPPIARGLALLRQAREYAVDLACDLWDFAVEIDALREAGMSHSDLRWLTCKEYVEHATEVSTPEKNGREFQPTGNLTFDERTCFVLTEPGWRFAGQLRPSEANSPPAVFSVPGPETLESNGSGTALGDTDLTRPESVEKPEQELVPSWDGSRHELHFDGALVKVFKLPSPNQEAILMVFEEEGWPPRIDDPLPRHSQIDPKRRLHDTIKGLNRNQKSRLIRFMGDGTGEGIRWEPRSASSKSAGAKAK